ncbi:acetate/propionate family kinase [Pseudomonas sp. MWU16-30317]|uniref:acetate/propionate family kinase n=1 Tax=Pseudomonas sp. MWU16-30317 TaxID=2878095 RepID=UPI001CFA5C04|nr:acetate/propionate family kinase [Pseudomonas sp. MWU16-30317]
MSTVLALNSGSSSLKFGVYRVDGQRIDTLLSGEAEGLGEDGATLGATGIEQETLADASVNGVMQRLGQVLERARLPTLDAVGHRLVHGGPEHLQPCLIDAQVRQQLQQASVFAPLHTPAALEVIDQARTHFSTLPHVACFDTGFHADLPAVAQTLALPRALHAQGIRRYGFHGLSCASIVRQLEDEIPERLIIVHLGNGASVTAVKQGKSVDTSMGLTPSGGIIMGTRSGDLDPGVLIYLLREKKLDVAKLEQLIDHQSGLLGISGVASDMRKLHQAAPDNADARLAIEMFCQAARKQIAAMVAVLEGVDLVVFTGGIGEHDDEVRQRIVNGLQWLNLEGNVRTLTSQEDEQIALLAAALI